MGGYRERGYKSAALPTELRRPNVRQCPFPRKTALHNNHRQQEGPNAAEHHAPAPAESAAAAAVELLSESRRVTVSSSCRMMPIPILASCGDAVSSKTGARKGL